MPAPPPGPTAPRVRTPVGQVRSRLRSPARPPVPAGGPRAPPSYRPGRPRRPPHCPPRQRQHYPPRQRQHRPPRRPLNRVEGPPRPWRPPSPASTWQRPPCAPPPMSRRAPWLSRRRPTGVRGRRTQLLGTPAPPVRNVTARPYPREVPALARTGHWSWIRVPCTPDGLDGRPARHGGRTCLRPGGVSPRGRSWWSCQVDPGAGGLSTCRWVGGCVLSCCRAYHLADARRQACQREKCINDKLVRSPTRMVTPVRVRRLLTGAGRWCRKWSEKEPENGDVASAVR